MYDDNEETRPLATVETVAEVWHHPNADRLDVAKIKGWQCVVGRDQFTAGDRVVYCEIDAALPLDREEFAFLGERKTRTVERNGESIQVHPLKTIRLRKQLSQGLVFDADAFPEAAGTPVGTDLTGVLGIVKWEPNASRQGNRRAGFDVKYRRPSFVPMTDAERVQNVPEALLVDEADGEWVATEKLDGTSTSFFFDHVNTFAGVCSRNLMLVGGEPSDPLGQVGFFNGRRKELETVAAGYGEKSVVFQGELVGPGIQGNGLKLDEARFFMFRFIVDGKDVPQSDWPDGVDQVPILAVPFPRTVDEALSAADGLVSVVSPGEQPEGIVWRNDGKPGRVPRCVKAISNKFLLADKDED